MYMPHWITIPAGPFQMGSDPAGDAVPYENEHPQHPVHVDAFQMARTHVTNAQYAMFVRATGYASPGHWLNGRIPTGLSDHPVTYVDWYDAQAFCMWAGARLPTEAEWEKAGRSEDGRIWPWGNRPPEAQRCNFANRLLTTSPVHQFPDGAGPYGTLDMAGNAWEWTSSLAFDYPYDARDGREEPTSGGARIVRGGSYIHGSRDIRVSDRHAFAPGTHDVYAGFRVVRSESTLIRPASIDWVDIPGGEFIMGNDFRCFHDLAFPSEYPLHTIALPEFSIAKTPVTNVEYETFVRATDHPAPGHWVDNIIPSGLAHHPVTNVSWDSAQAFCLWADVRLLTEAEWEKAARGAGSDDAFVYPWGNDIPETPCANYGQDAKLHATTSVECFPHGVSPYGVFDMAGNVWEWTSSVLADYPYRMDDGREELSSRGARVLRGGSFYSPSASYIRCATRSSSYPQRSRDHIGFRVAKK